MSFRNCIFTSVSVVVLENHLPRKIIYQVLADRFDFPRAKVTGLYKFFVENIWHHDNFTVIITPSLPTHLDIKIFCDLFCPFQVALNKFPTDANMFSKINCGKRTLHARRLTRRFGRHINWRKTTRIVICPPFITISCQWNRLPINRWSAISPLISHFNSTNQWTLKKRSTDVDIVHLNFRSATPQIVKSFCPLVCSASFTVGNARHFSRFLVKSSQINLHTHQNPIHLQLHTQKFCSLNSSSPNTRKHSGLFPQEYTSSHLTLPRKTQRNGFHPLSLVRVRERPQPESSLPFRMWLDMWWTSKLQHCYLRNAWSKILQMSFYMK